MTTARTKEALLFTADSLDAQQESDPYLASKKPQSLLCVPLIQKGQLTGILYLVGGPLNPFGIVYLVGITVAAVSLGLRWAVALAVLVAVPVAAGCAGGGPAGATSKKLMPSPLSR